MAMMKYFLNDLRNPRLVLGNFVYWIYFWLLDNLFVVDLFFVVFRNLDGVDGTGLHVN
jgi:hypothetical protein